MAVVINFDALRRFGQVKSLRHPFQMFALARILGHPAEQCPLCVHQRMIDHFLFRPALRRLDPHDALRRDRKGLADQLCIGKFMACPDAPGRRAAVIELTDEGGQHVGGAIVLVVGRVVRAVAEILARAQEEDLHAGLPALLIGGDDIHLVF